MGFLPNEIVAVKQNMLLTLPEFCAATGMSLAWGRSAIASRRIAVVRIGRSVRIPATELRRIIEHGLVPAREDRNGR